ncbi:MAG: hypothetical protein WBN13_03315 [Robiginitalea sp.]|uniref:hypothetical protein n=1 Tax=Robiginitalea sp. TaxID=1902411 RepID=UPI003C77FB73
MKRAGSSICPGGIQEYPNIVLNRFGKSSPEFDLPYQDLKEVGWVIKALQQISGSSIG